ncbi:MAG TPA: molybdopterin-dependent oxidoreductase, partial [Candidatus Baltobacteraceae bacterium]|nr:molybdopterin-dependent oxidoreductase [Candidatus Baltobacteraceae bacterium]
SKTYRFKSRPWDLNRTHTSCTQCAVGCQQFADVRYGTLLRTMSVETDDDISDTWLCDRGRYNIGFYSSPERITQPLYKKGGTFVQIDWTDAIELWAKAIRDGVRDGGPSTVGAIGGGRLTNEEAYVLQHVFRGVGVTNLDWRAGHQRQATPGAKSGRLADIEKAQAIVIAGESPEELAPILWLRVLKALRKGAKLIHEPDAASALRQAQADAGQRVALIWDGVDLAAGKAFADAFAGAGELWTYIASEQGNARGAEAMGMLPGSGPGFASVANAGHDGWSMFEEARNGTLSVLSILGANPLRNSSVADGMNAALGSVPFLVVSDLFLTETASHATLVLPAKGALEKSGTTTNLAGDLLPVNQALQSPDGVRSDLEMLIDLCDALGVDLPPPDVLDAAVIAAAAKIPDFTFGDPLFATVACEERQPGHRPILSGGGTWKHDPTMTPLRSGNGVLV